MKVSYGGAKLSKICSVFTTKIFDPTDKICSGKPQKIYFFRETDGANPGKKRPPEVPQKPILKRTFLVLSEVTKAKDRDF